MLTIDTTLSQQRLIVTISEKAIEAITSNPLAFQFATWGDWPIPTWDNSAATYTMTVTSTYSNVSYSISLPENTSPYTDRYDEFIIETPAWELGSYNYSIAEDNTSVVVEIGNLTVTNGATPSYISIPAVSGEEDFIIYKNSNE